MPFKSVFDFCRQFNASVTWDCDPLLGVYFFKVDFKNGDWHWVKNISEFELDNMCISRENLEMAYLNQCYIEYMRLYHCVY